MSQVKGKRPGIITAADPAEHAIIALLPLGHEELVILKDDVPELHPDLSLDAFQVDGLDIVNAITLMVDVGQLAAVGVDFPVVGIAGEKDRAGRRWPLHDPGPEAGAVRVAIVAPVLEELIPEVESCLPGRFFELRLRHVAGMESPEVVRRVGHQAKIRP